MKKIMYLFILSGSLAQARYCEPIPAPDNESFEQALERFERMSARQIYHLNIHALNSVQMQAFRELSREKFLTEIASHNCNSQADRIKAEIMYKKIAERDEALFQNC